MGMHMLILNVTLQYLVLFFLKLLKDFYVDF